MRLIVDANILFATLIKNSKTYDLILDKHLQLYTPEFIFIELEKYKQELLRKAHRSVGEFHKLIEDLKRIIVIVSLDELLPFLENAENISPDPKDETYFALALKLNCGIWSNDKRLKKQDKVKIYSTEDLIKVLNNAKERQLQDLLMDEKDIVTVRDALEKAKKSKNI